MLLVLYSIFCVPRSLLDQRHLLLPSSLLSAVIAFKLLHSNCIKALSNLTPSSSLHPELSQQQKESTPKKNHKFWFTGAPNYAQPPKCIKCVCYLTPHPLFLRKCDKTTEKKQEKEQEKGTFLVHNTIKAISLLAS